MAHRHGSGLSSEFSPNEIPPLEVLLLDKLKRQLLQSHFLLGKTHVWVEAPVPSVAVKLSGLEVEPRRLRRFLVIMKTEKV